MKILFINPSRSGQGNIPINIPLLIGGLKKTGHDVSLFDLSDYKFFDDNVKKGIFFKNAPLANEKILDDINSFNNKNRGNNISGIGLKTSDYYLDFEKLLIDFKPDIIAVSCLSVDFKFICKFLTRFKIQYNLKIIFGGIHAILNPEETIRSHVCDIICTGEGETSFPMLLEAMEENKPLENIKGFWFKKGGKIIKSHPMPLPSLSDLPNLNFDNFSPIHFYRPFDGKRYKMLNYELSRGCPYNCSYCVSGSLKKKYRGLGKFHRIKDLNQSIEELKRLIEKYKFDFIRFWDEDFTAIKTDYLKQYASLYVEEINLPFLIYSRIESITDIKVEILKNMGCKTFAMGIESGSEHIRNKIMNRKMSNKTIINKFNLVKSFGIRVSSYNIIGLPYETRKDIFETIELNRKVRPDSFSVTTLEPYKGTPIRKMCEEQGLDPNYEVTEYFGGRDVHFTPKGMTSQELIGLARTFPFYVSFSKDKYSEIKFAEKDDRIYNKMLKQFIKIIDK